MVQQQQLHDTKLVTEHMLEACRQCATFTNFGAATEKLGFGSDTTNGWLWSTINEQGDVEHIWGE